MDWTIQEVRSAFSGRLIGSLFMRKVVCETLLLLPPKIIDFITSNVWFVSSPEDSWAFTFRGSDIKNQHLIILSDELLDQEERQIKFTILHEIGHVMLGHKNSMGFEQTQMEIKRQERDADRFVKEVIRK